MVQLELKSILNFLCKPNWFQIEIQNEYRTPKGPKGVIHQVNFEKKGAYLEIHFDKLFQHKLAVQSYSCEMRHVLILLRAMGQQLSRMFFASVSTPPKHKVLTHANMPLR